VQDGGDLSSFFSVKKKSRQKLHSSSTGHSFWSVSLVVGCFGVSGHVREVGGMVAVDCGAGFLCVSLDSVGL